jgi:hypothetical protein
MTNEEIRALLELEAKASPAPWFFNSYSTVQCRPEQNDDVCYVPAEHGDQAQGGDTDNGWFIPAARNVIRPLAEEVLRLRDAFSNLIEVSKLRLAT